MDKDESLAYQSVVIATLREGIARVTQATQSGLSAAELALEAQQIRHKILELQSAARIDALVDEVRKLQDELAQSRRQARDWKMMFDSLQNGLTSAISAETEGNVKLAA